LARKTIAPGLILAHELDVDTHLDIECPLCRTISTSTFRAEDVIFPDGMRECVKEMAIDIYHEFRQQFAP
jgi:hypothetical protein